MKSLPFGNIFFFAFFSDFCSMALTSYPTRDRVAATLRRLLQFLLKMFDPGMFRGLF